jgi:hypothetical protein
MFTIENMKHFVLSHIREEKSDFSQQYVKMIKFTLAHLESKFLDHRETHKKKKPFGDFLYSKCILDNLCISLYTVTVIFCFGAGITSGCNLQNTGI